MILGKVHMIKSYLEGGYSIYRTTKAPITRTNIIERFSGLLYFEEIVFISDFFQNRHYTSKRI